MFEWLGDAIGSVSDAASSVDWGAVASESFTTALIGAGVGALVSAVSDGDISQGLLFGATGGLVAGGLSSFGAQFFENFEFSSAQRQADTMESMDAKELEALREGGANIPTISAGPTKNLIEQYVDKGASGQSGVFGGFWSPQTTAAALQVGGSMLAGAFKRDTEGETLDFAKEREQRGREAVRSFAAGGEKRGTYKPGISVREQVKNKEAIGFSKEEAGVHV